MYSEHWEQLPEWLRFRYALASAISPGAISSAEGRRNHTWSDAVLQEVADYIELPKAADLHDADEAATDAFGWELHIDEYLRQWSETDQRHIAAEAVRNLLIRETNFTHDDTLAEVARVVERDTTPSVHTARTIIALHAERFIKDVASAAKAIAVVLDYLRYDDTAAAERAHLYDLYQQLGHTGLDDHTDLRVRLNGIDAIDSLGRSSEAVDAYREIQATSVVKPDHPDFLQSRFGLGWALRDVGRLDEALTTLKQLHADCVRLLGNDDLITLASRLAMAWVLQERCRFDEAIPILKQAHADVVRVRGKDHPFTLGSHHNLAKALEAADQLDEPLATFEQLHADFVRVRGDNHPDTLKARHSLASALADAFELDRAIETFRQLYTDCARVLGSNHPETLSSRQGLALALQDVGEIDEAIETLRQLHSDSVRVLGNNHPQTLFSLASLAGALRKEYRFGEAIALYRQVHADYVRVLGEDHPDTLDTGHCLASTLEEADEFGEAIAPVQTAPCRLRQGARRGPSRHAGHRSLSGVDPRGSR